MYSSDVTAHTDMKWYQIWWYVWTHPNAEGFRTILRDSQVSAKRGLVWVGVTSLISTLVSILIRLAAYGFVQHPISDYLRTITLPLFYSIVGLTIVAGVSRFIAKLFGGAGTWDKLVFCFAAIDAPENLFDILMDFRAALFTKSNLMAIEVLLTYIIPLLILAVDIYALILYGLAIAAVEEVSQRKAVVIFLILLVIILPFNLILWVVLR